MKIVITYLLRCIEVSKLSFELSMMLFTWVRRIVWMVIVTGRWSCVQLITNTCKCMNLETWWMLSSIWSSTWRESEKKGNEFISIHKEWWAVNDFIFTTLIIYFLWRVLFIQTHSHLFFFCSFYNGSLCIRMPTNLIHSITNRL